MSAHLPLTAVATEPQPAELAHTFVLRLGRAVQRASMYPAGHPAAAVGFRPLIDALAALTAEGDLTIAVGRSRLLVSSPSLPPTEQRSPWLAARLFEREIAVVTVSASLDAVDLETFVGWLGRPLEPGVAWPEMAGLQLARFDGARLRFVETSSERPEGDDVDKAWWALTAALRRSYGIGDDLSTIDPETLGDEIRQALDAVEGMGISRLIDEIVNLHAGLADCDADTRSSALLKLAVLVDHLAPEVRGTLFTITPDDSPEKLALVDDLLPLLSEPSLADIAANLASTVAANKGPFSRFLRRLGEVAADHPLVQDVLDRRANEVGVPASLFGHDGHDGYDAGGTPNGTDGLEDFVPDAYRQQLDDLSTSGAGVDRAPHPSSASTNEGIIDAHLVRMAVHVTKETPTSETAEVYLARLIDLLPREVARGNATSVTLAAGLVLWLRGQAVATSGAAAALFANLQALFASPELLAFMFSHVEAVPAGRAHDSTTWLIAGGEPAIAATFDRLRTSHDPVQRQKLAAALMAHDEHTFGARLAPVLVAEHRIAESFASALPVVEPARAIVCGMMLSTHAAAFIRRRALVSLLSGRLAPGKARIMVHRALAEGDSATTKSALDFAERHPGPAMFDALAEYLTEPADPQFGPAQARAIRLIASGGDPTGLLSATLKVRGWRFSRADRAVSVRLASTLAGGTFPGAAAALASWRRAPARLWSLFTAPVQEVP